MQELEDNIKKLEARFKLTFNDKVLIQTALTHSSFARCYPEGGVKDNERLEFFGDAVLKLVVSEYIFAKYPTYNEGKLTHIRSIAVSDETLAKIGKKIELGSFLVFSHGESNSGGAMRVSNLANAMEALFGAIYLDKGIEAARDFIIPLYENFEPKLLTGGQKKDGKSSLQEFAQKNHLTLPSYQIIKEEGPDHEKIFEVQCEIMYKDKPYAASGKGNNKKAAEQEAAKCILKLLKAK